MGLFYINIRLYYGSWSLENVEGYNGKDILDKFKEYWEDIIKEGGYRSKDQVI